MPLAVMKLFQHMWIHSSWLLSCLFNEHVNLWDGQDCVLCRAWPPTFVNALVGPWGEEVLWLLYRVWTRKGIKTLLPLLVWKMRQAWEEGITKNFASPDRNISDLNWVWLCFLFHNGALKNKLEEPDTSTEFFFFPSFGPTTVYTAWHTDTESVCLEICPSV